MFRASTEMKLKPLYIEVLVAILTVFPLTTFAQNSNGPLTRAQVLQDLCDLEEVGYRPAQASSLHYPYDIEVAEQRLAAKRSQRASGNDVLPSSKSKLETDNLPAVKSTGRP